MPSADEILEALENGKWHDFTEISEKTNMPEFKVKLLTHFLAEYRFIELDGKKQRTRLVPSVQLFLRRVRETSDRERQREISQSCNPQNEPKPFF